MKRQAADPEKPVGVPRQAFFRERRIGRKKDGPLVEGQGAFGLLQNLVS